MISLQDQILSLQKKVSELEKKPYSKLEEIILNSDYKVLCFAGLANGTNLVLRNNLDEITDKRMLIKSFKIVPYYSADGFDISLSDGVTEPVFNNTRIIKLYDFFTVSTKIELDINGGIAPIFTVPGAEGYPLDLFVDNIYYKVTSIITSLNVRITGATVQNLVTGAAAVPNVKVVIECYSY